MSEVTDLRIARLLDHPAAIDVVAGWIDAEWGGFSGRTLAETRARFTEDEAATLPRSYVALDGSTPVGVASLRTCDSVDWDPGVGPWLCNVYVPAEARGAGVAARLCSHVAGQAMVLGFPALFLASAAGDDSLYYRIGYRTYRVVDHDGETLHLMKRSLRG